MFSSGYRTIKNLKIIFKITENTCILIHCIRHMTYISLTDHELAVLFKAGDHGAFTVIYQRYWKRIYLIAIKRLGDEQDAEEVVQDIFLNLWRKRDKFELTTCFQNYFAVAVKFEIFDIMRKRASIAAYGKTQGISYSEADESMLRKMDFLELQEKFQLTIRALPDKCQLVFRLKHEQGYSQKQISNELDISEKTVEAHLSKARKILKATFGSLLSAVLIIYF
jgi:RNA polymerase sigma-70 factor (family 1)